MRKSVTTSPSRVPPKGPKQLMSKTQLRFCVLQKYDQGWTYQGILNYYHERGYALSTTFIANALREREALHPELQERRHSISRPPTQLTPTPFAPSVAAVTDPSAPVDPWRTVTDLLRQLDETVRRLEPTATLLEYDFLRMDARISYQQVATRSVGLSAVPELVAGAEIPKQN